jgi:restriction system protein
MAIPPFHGFFHPLLRVLQEHPNGVRRRDAIEAAANLVGITDEERQKMLPSGVREVYRDRIVGPTPI